MNLSSSGLKAIVPSPISSPPQMWDSAKDTCDMADTSGNVALPGSLDDAAQEQEQDARRAEQPDGGKQGEQVVADATPSASNSGDHVEMLLAALSEMQATHEAKIADMLTQHMDRILGSACQREAHADVVNSDNCSPLLLRPCDGSHIDSDKALIAHRAHRTSTRSALSGHSGTTFSARMLSQRRSTVGRSRRVANHSTHATAEGEAASAATLRSSFHLDASVDNPSRTARRDELALRRWARNVVVSPKFELAVAALIFANAFLMGVEADLAVQDSNPDPPMWSAVAEVCFAVAFTMELVVHALDEGKSYFHPFNKMAGWNVFDACVVALSWFDIALAATQAKFSGIRMIRILKLTRALRIVRVMRYCRELREMVQGIAASLKPLFWCLVLLLLVWFTMGICILQVEHQYIIDYPALDHSEMLKFYGGMIKTIYTLFTTITGGKDWYDAAALLGDMSPIMPVIFCVYIAFAVLCVLNIVTGVFVEHSKSMNARDAENMVLEEVNSREKRTTDMKKVFNMAVQTFKTAEELDRGDSAQSGDEHSKCLQEEQFIAFCEDASCQAYFRSIGLLVEGASAINLFRFIDYDNDGFITQDEFVSQCNVLQGPARQLDVALLQYELHQLFQMSQKIWARLSAPRRSESLSAPRKSESLTPAVAPLETVS
mmetsp:Transcript_77824/g.238107  ORF Transcript_77824/g.238107 Transcript_77824/m.238107 type:complete len:662 (-) Transcript_77824:192-2177(-)